MSSDSQHPDLTGTSFLTGFPGFLTSMLLRELVQALPEGTFHLLVEARFESLARQRVAALRDRYPKFEGELHLHVGDITAPRLGLSDETWSELTARVATVWHLAAIYNLAVPESLAYKVNVSGTIGVLDFCEACSKLERFNYISTCYVSGERTGLIFEDELDEGQGHNNHYESTKFWAEVEVQRRSHEIPTAIFRPSIVVGDSQTGETDKYDGPYYLFQVFKNLPSWMPVPNIGRGEAVVNIIPADFAARALAHIGLEEGHEGTVFQLADPNPMKARDIVALTLDLLGRKKAPGTVPPKLLDAALANRKVEEFMGVPREVVDYFNHEARYDTSNTLRALGDTEIRSPHLSSYLQTLMDYVDRHPDKSFLDSRRI